MESDYERKQYKFIYLIGSILAVLAMIAWLFVRNGELSVTEWGCVIILGVVLFVFYRISYGRVNKLYGEMEKLSGMMNEVMEQCGDMVEEEYYEGAVRIWCCFSLSSTLSSNSRSTNTFKDANGVLS